eukprot:3998273-Pyramimonas_sp.AAC.1
MNLKFKRTNVLPKAQAPALQARKRVPAAATNSVVPGCIYNPLFAKKLPARLLIGVGDTVSGVMHHSRAPLGPPHYKEGWCLLRQIGAILVPSPPHYTLHTDDSWRRLRQLKPRAESARRLTASQSVDRKKAA